MTDALVLSDGRLIEVILTDADEISIVGDVSRLAPADAGLLGQGIERAAVVAGQRAARRRIRARQASGLTIEEIADGLPRRP